MSDHQVVPPPTLRLDPGYARREASDGLGFDDGSLASKRLEFHTRGVVQASDAEWTVIRDPLLNAPPEFLWRPRHILQDYQTRRERSPLGQVFRIANGLHDSLDAVLVVGEERSLAGIRAIMRACCHPYHNELSRAERGSKPRLYSVGHHCDNDHLVALCQRLSCGESDHTDANRRWAIVILDSPNSPSTTPLILDGFFSALQKSLVVDHDSDGWLSRLVIPVTTPDSSLAKWARSNRCQELVSADENWSEATGALSPAGLLPAAFLGLDCVQLLVGAHAMAEHFQNSNADENLVWRWVSSTESDRQAPASVGAANGYQPPALSGIPLWVRCLEEEGRVHGQNHDGDERIARYGSPPLRIVVESCRTDPVNVAPLGQPETRKPLAQWQRECREDSPDASATLVLPRIDANEIGQLLQLLMIANACQRTWVTAREPETRTDVEDR